jgi:hypothetical protein
VLRTVTFAAAAGPCSSPSKARTSTLTTCLFRAVRAGTVSTEGSSVSGVPATENRYWYWSLSPSGSLAGFFTTALMASPTRGSAGESAISSAPGALSATSASIEAGAPSASPSLGVAVTFQRSPLPTVPAGRSGPVQAAWTWPSFVHDHR